MSTPAPHIERLLGGIPANAGLVTVLDGHPATLGWLGAVLGHRTRPLGVEHFGQTGSIPDLYRHYGIDAMHHRRRPGHRAGPSDPPPPRARMTDAVRSIPVAIAGGGPVG